MTDQAAHPYAPGLADAGAQVARLRQVLALVVEITGTACGGEDSALDEAARISAAYDIAPPIAQRRFDRLAEETERWAAAGVETLIVLREREKPYTAAAGRLADAIAAALEQLGRAVSL